MADENLFKPFHELQRIGPVSKQRLKDEGFLPENVAMLKMTLRRGKETVTYGQNPEIGMYEVLSSDVVPPVEPVVEVRKPRKIGKFEKLCNSLADFIASRPIATVLKRPIFGTYEPEPARAEYYS